MHRMSELGDGRVLRLREVCEDNDGLHLVMELCEGGELFDRIFEREHYSERAAAKLTRTIIEVDRRRPPRAELGAIALQLRRAGDFSHPVRRKSRSVLCALGRENKDSWWSGERDNNKFAWDSPCYSNPSKQQPSNAIADPSHFSSQTQVPVPLIQAVSCMLMLK